MKRVMLVLLLVGVANVQTHAEIFSDGFESGDTCPWSEAMPRCGFCVDASTVALWRFDELFGQTLHDASGNGRDLTLGPTIAVEDTDPSRTVGKFGLALHFDSTSLQYASGDGSNSFPSNQLTAELWYRPTGGNGIDGGAQVFTAGVLTCAMTTYTETNKIHFAVGNGDDWSYVNAEVPGSDLDDGAWHYLAMTYDGSTLAAYVDGQLVDAQPFTTSLGSPSDYKVGGRYQNTYLDGWLDEVRLSDVARSAQEIQTTWAGAAACQ